MVRRHVPFVARPIFRGKLLVLARVIFGKHFCHISADHPTGKFSKMIRKDRLPALFLEGEGRVQDRMIYRMFPHKGHHEIRVLSQVSNLLKFAVFDTRSATAFNLSVAFPMCVC